MTTEPLTPKDSIYHEAVTRIAALMQRWYALHPQELAREVKPEDTTLYLGVRHLRSRDMGWDPLFRAIDGLERSTTQRESAQESA